MPLNLVIGYADKKISPDSATILYAGSDGAEAKRILHTPNADHPVRERYTRPFPNGGRRIDAAPATEEPATEEPAAEEPAAEEPAAEEPAAETTAEESPEEPSGKKKK